MAAVTKNLTIVNEMGLHARPAAEFVKVASQFQAEVQVSKNDGTVNGKSIMGVLTLAAECGSQLKVSAEGIDAEAAVDALEKLVAAGFSDT